MDLSPENNEHSYLKGVWVLIGVQEEAGVDLFGAPGQKFEGSLHNSRPWGIIAEAAESLEAEFLACNHPKGCRDISLTRRFLFHGISGKVWVKFYFVAYFLPPHPDTSSFLCSHRAASIDNVQAKDRLRLLISTTWDHLAPLVSVQGPAEPFNSDLFLGPLVLKKEEALCPQAFMGEVRPSTPCSHLLVLGFGL